MPKKPSKGLAEEVAQSPRLIQSPDFPFEFLSAVAQRESWRKEIYRPIYHIHKWWAKRLGSVFRGIILGCLLPPETDLTSTFYQLHDFTGVTVFDPFFGSGTTLGEAHKLGCTALGRDINPVACESVRVALGPLNERELRASFEDLTDSVGKRIRDLYRSPDDKGRLRDGRGHRRGAAYVFAPHPETGADADRGQRPGYAQEFRLVPKPVFQPAVAGHRVSRGTVRSESTRRRQGLHRP